MANCDDYDPDRTQAHIDDWIRRRERGVGGRPFTCAKANQLGVGCGDCALEPKEKLDKVGNALLHTGEMAEPSPYRFCYPPPDRDQKKEVRMSLNAKNSGKQGKIKQTKTGRDTWRLGADGFVIPQTSGQEDKIYPKAEDQRARGNGGKARRKK